jgi:hypothetical protein
MKGVENMSLIPLPLMTVKLTKKIKLLGKTSAPPKKIFTQNFKRKASEGKSIGK